MVEANPALNKPFSKLQKIRHEFVPGTPACIADVQNTKVSLKRSMLPIRDELTQMFPTLLADGANGMQQLEIVIDNENGSILKSDTPVRIGCVLSGGQAAGGHNVIMGLFDMIRKLNPESRLFGFLAGPHGVYTNNYMEITPEYMGLYRNTGGFDMIRSGRHKIETPEQFASSLDNAKQLDLDGLVVIGGDDSNTNACLLAEYFAKHNAKCKVVGCPKTIDGDLKNEHIPVSFGFDTATKVYSEAIGNLCSDVCSSKDYYHFIRLMGRSASHIALECALRTRINCVLVGEEVKAKAMTLAQITTQVTDIICKRAELGKNYGIILVPEGLIEFIPEVAILISEINELVSREFSEDIRDFVTRHLTSTSQALFNLLPPSISQQLLLDRDPHGNVQVSKIDTEKLLILLVKKELELRQSENKYSGSFKPQSHFFGYEGRCALPSNFDSQYCYSLGLNAAVLIREGVNGYMSCVKNLTDKNPANWQAAGCPLPTMMHIERRAGKDKPVIEKALVELEGGMFKAYEAVRDKWAYLDCYQSPGPIQFKGAASDELNYMVQPPCIDSLVADANEIEKLEKSGQRFNRKFELLSELSQARVQDAVEIPDTLNRGQFSLTATKRAVPPTQVVAAKMDVSFPTLKNCEANNYFVEIQDDLITNTTHFDHSDVELRDFNARMLAVDKSKAQKIGLVFMGRQAPGGNNVVDGLLRYQAQRSNVELIGFINGVDGLMANEHAVMTRENFANFINLGGYDYIGRGGDELRTAEQKSRTLQVCTSLGLTGLVLVGATATMTDSLYLAEYFEANQAATRVVMIPATVDGNIHHKYFQSAIGFDTASKVYSQLIGNMLTDSASAIKYWYFIRLMGKGPSHVAVECALQTSPNLVIVSEQCQDRHESLKNVVDYICDLICRRAEAGQNYGCILIPEGLLAHIGTFNNLIIEINKLFSTAKTMDEQEALLARLTDEDQIKELLSPWTYSLFASLPDFFKQQMLVNREVEGCIKLAAIETEKLISYFVERELKERKAKGTYTGSFAPVSHYFGYQGRSGHPSMFDCSLGSTAGFASAVLVEQGLTGMAVSVRQCTQPVSTWRVGGVPIVALLQSHPKEGFKTTDLVVRSEPVNLTSQQFQMLKAKQHVWKWQDSYINPGPLQFYHDAVQDREIAQSLHHMYDRTDNLTEEIRGLCHSIQNDTLFTEHRHLLVAALNSLKSAKQVMNSLSQDLNSEL